ncbi:ankyrin repeat domain-containing protein [Spiroplasma endosymbiont of Clivina fossor]|uniref:ankyrin repeat domain-containing protein n=1 Tax=Spiroplasma endosymbiont of Clivina fossor TaxID=3066282 RepID=UPI00313BCA55
MKKLLELLGTITIASSAMLTVIAAAPNRKHSIKKRQNNEDISTTPKPQDEQQALTITPDNQIEIIDKLNDKDIILTLNENYSESIEKMLQELINEKYIDPLRSINMGGLISAELDNKTIISKLEELESKMTDWIKEQKNNKEKILILTLKKKKDETKNNDEDKEIKLVIRLENFYVLGFINNQNQYFDFKDEKLKQINDLKNKITKLGERTKQNATKYDKLQKDLAKSKIIQNINKAIIEKYYFQENNFNLDYTADYNEEGLDVIIREQAKDTGKDIPISQKTLKDAVANLADYTHDSTKTEEETQTIKDDLVRLIFVTSETMRFQCDGKTLEIYAKFKNDKELTDEEIDKLKKESNLKQEKRKELKNKFKNIIEENLGKKSNIIQLIKNDKWGEISGEIKNNKLIQEQELITILNDIKNFDEENDEIKNKLEIAELNKIINKSKNILSDVQKILQENGKIVYWKEYTTQLRGDGKEFGGWKEYSKIVNKFRIKIWEQLIKMKKLNDFIFNEKEDLINNLLDKILEIKDNEQEIKKVLIPWFDKKAKANNDLKNIKNDFVNEVKNFIKVQMNPLNLKILNNLSSDFTNEQNIIKKQQEIFPEINQNFKTKNDIEKLDQEVKTEITNIINNISSNNTSLLCWSITQNNLDIAKLLLMLNSNLEVINGYWANLSPLHYGSYLGNIEIVKELLKYPNINFNILDNNGNGKNTPLNYAIIMNNIEIVKELLTNQNSKNKIEVNPMVEDDLSPLHYAAFFGYTEIIKLLLASGSNTNAKYVNNTPLNIATNNGHVEAQNLLKKFNELNQKIIKDKELLKNLSEKLTPEQKQELEKRIKERIKNTKKELKTLLQPTYDVPADNSCLFWSVSTSYLLPVRNNNEEFRNRFIQLFGEENLKYLLHIQKLLQQYDLEDNRNLNQLWYQDQTANNLVINFFRNRVVDYIQSNLDTIPNRNGELTFRNLIQDNNDIDTNYLEIMRQPSTWGGTPEIIAMSNLLNANISVNNNGSYQPVNQNANNNNIAISYVELKKGSGVHNHYNFALTPEEERTNHPVAINDNQGNVPVVDTTNRQDNLPITTPKSDAKTIKLPVDVHGQHPAILSNNNDDASNRGNNIINSQISTTTKAINKYNALSKEEKLKKLNEINRYYQTLSENDKKSFKEKLTNTGLAALSGGTLTAYGTKMTVSSTATTSAANAEVIEMTPLLSTSTTEGLAAAETITVAETAAVEGGIIAGETGTAAALAPETLGLSLVIGGLAIAGTWMYFAFHHHATSDIAFPTSIHHNVYDNIEKWYKFLAHDKLKIKINKTTWNEIKQNKNSPANIIKIIKNKFVINDHSGWGGSVTNEDFNTFVKVIVLHFEQINGYFEILDNENDGFVIITNTEGDWLGIE